jgi:hypothetical protein
MRHAVLTLCAGALAASMTAPPLAAQTAAKRTPEQIKASFEAHKGDFDYLLGDWEFTAESKEYGKFRGYWSAVRLDEGQILDEYRIVDEKGETIYVTSSLRNYNSVLDRWELVGADAGTGLQDIGTGRRVGAEMHIEQRFGVMSDQPSVWKIRYYDIRPDRFSWTADRSLDGGKTWVVKHQQIEARRIGPRRAMGPLAPARQADRAEADPISGTWTGQMGPNADNRTDITVELKFDGKTITGTITGPPNPGEIRSGTFDPKTGALKLEVLVKDDAGTVAIFEGTVVNGTATGRVTFNNQTGDFKITKGAGG